MGRPRATSTSGALYANSGIIAAPAYLDAWPRAQADVPAAWQAAAAAAAQPVVPRLSSGGYATAVGGQPAAAAAMLPPLLAAASSGTMGTAGLVGPPDAARASSQGASGGAAYRQVHSSGGSGGLARAKVRCRGCVWAAHVGTGPPLHVAEMVLARSCCGLPPCAGAASLPASCALAPLPYHLV